jgi:hypothetical protein
MVVVSLAVSRRLARQIEGVSGRFFETITTGQTRRQETEAGHVAN